MPAVRVDLNGDVGESFGAFAMGHDEGLMPALTSANVACGFHAGDPGVMRATVALAHSHGVAVGAHPGFPDLVGFGRREMQASPQEVEDFVVYQIGALAAIAARQGVTVQHVKPHGALYNMAARDRALADAIVRATVAVDRSLVMFALSGSQLLESARTAGLRVASEAFADRAYRSDGSLVPRSEAGAVIHDVEAVVSRAVAIVADQGVTAVGGGRVALDVNTLCVHGDTPGAAELAMSIRRALVASGVRVTAVGDR